MILGRATNLWLGATTALFNVVVLLLASASDTTDIPVVDTLNAILTPVVVGAVNVALAAIITLVANQPPTLAPGDTYNIQTPKGQPNYDATVAPPPAPTRPTPDLSPK